MRETQWGIKLRWFSAGLRIMSSRQGCSSYPCLSSQFTDRTGVSWQTRRTFKTLYKRPSFLHSYRVCRVSRCLSPHWRLSRGQGWRWRCGCPRGCRAPRRRRRTPRTRGWPASRCWRSLGSLDRRAPTPSLTLACVLMSSVRRYRVKCEICSVRRYTKFIERGKEWRNCKHGLTARGAGHNWAVWLWALSSESWVTCPGTKMRTPGPGDRLVTVWGVCTPMRGYVEPKL